MKGENMELTKRQEEILKIIKEKSPISGEEIAEKLGMSRSALRTDFSILRKLSMISSKQNQGYYYKKLEKKTKIKHAMGDSKGFDSKRSVYETIIYMFENDVGSVFLTEDKDTLVGVVSRKDLLKASLGNKNLEKLPIHMVMTRMPNLIYVREEDSIKIAVQKIMKHEIDSLAVVKQEGEKYRLVGRFSKTNVARLYLETL